VTHAQAVLLITPISLAMITWALLKLVQETMPRRPVPVYFSNGTVDRLAQAIHSAAGEEQVGIIDSDGFLVIRGERFMMRFEGLEESPIIIRRKDST